MEKQLKTIFDTYARGADKKLASNATTEMDTRTFVKLMKDAKVVGKKVSVTDCDLAFAAVKEKSLKKINFMQFMDGLDYLCGKSGQAPAALQQQLVNNCADGPQYQGSGTSDPNSGPARFFYDKTTHTGIATRGGPKTIDETEGYADLSGLTVRGKMQHDALQRKKAEAAGGQLDRGKIKSAGTARGDGIIASRSARPSRRPVSALARGASSGLAASPRPKSARPTKKLSTRASRTGETPKAKAKPKSPAGGAPRGPERFFYDKDTYTGAATKGGPSVDGGTIRMSNLTDRTKAQDDGLHRKGKAGISVRGSGVRPKAKAKAKAP